MRSGLRAVTFRVTVSGMKTSRKFRQWVRRRSIVTTAADVGVHKVSVYRWLSGEDNPSEDNMKVLAKLATAEGVTLTYADFGYKLPALT